MGTRGDRRVQHRAKRSVGIASVESIGCACGSTYEPGVVVSNPVGPLTEACKCASLFHLFRCPLRAPLVMNPCSAFRLATTSPKRSFYGAIVKGWSMPARARCAREAHLRRRGGQASSKPRGRKPRVELRRSATARCYGDWNWGGAAEGDGGGAGLGAHGVMRALVWAKMSCFGATIPIADAISMA